MSANDIVAIAVLFVAYGLTWVLLIWSMRIVNFIDKENLRHIKQIRDRLEAGTTAGPLPSHPRGPVPAAAARPWAVSLGSWGTAVLRHRKAAVVIAAALTAGFGGILLTLGRRSGLTVDPNRVVVGVFENRTADESLDYLGPLISDCITEELSQTGLVKVVPVPSCGRTVSLAGYLARCPGRGAERPERARICHAEMAVLQWFVGLRRCP